MAYWPLESAGNKNWLDAIYFELMRTTWCVFILWIGFTQGFISVLRSRSKLQLTTFQSSDHLNKLLQAPRKVGTPAPRASSATVRLAKKEKQDSWLEERLSIVSVHEIRLDATSLTTQCLARELFRELYYNPLKVRSLSRVCGFEFDSTQLNRGCLL